MSDSKIMFLFGERAHDPERAETLTACRGCGVEFEAPIITWEGWWCDCEKAEGEAAQYEFTLLAHSSEIGDFRPANEHDLELAGFVRRERLEAAEREIARLQRLLQRPNVQEAPCTEMTL